MRRSGFFALFAVAVSALLGAASGCELIASVDRTKIETGPGGGGAGGAGGSTGGVAGNPTTGGGGTGGMACDPANCPAPSDECKVAACDMTGACIEENVPDGQDATTQAPGDCKKNVCMGGTVMSTNDDADTLDDMNECTVDSCNMGSPESAPAASGAMCTSGGTVCNGSGMCVECLTNADCADPNPVCSAGNQCIPATCTDTILNGDETDVDCGGSICDPCDTGMDCLVGGDCYHGVCATQGMSMQCAAPTCSDGVKNGGDYLAMPYNGETDVDCGGPCAPGDKCAATQGCNVDGDCVGDECTGVGGTCVPNCQDLELNNAETDIDCGGGTCNGCMVGQMCAMSDSNCDAMTAYCDTGVCAAKKAPGVTCGGTNECLMGVCDATDGVCCDMMCSGTCQSCTDGAMPGVCGPIAASADPDNECMNGACNGMGACALDNGQTCAMGAECLSANCIDGVCCNTACGALCQACNVTGSVGTCSNVPEDADPANECPGALSCDGNGACQKDIGATCASAAECGSGFCVDGVCCNTACTGTMCQACDVAGFVGTCSPIPAGADLDNECSMSTPNCNGNLGCGAGPAGAPCVTGNNCFNNSACPGNGICGPGTTDDPCVPGTMSCDVGGAVTCPAGGTCP